MGIIVNQISRAIGITKTSAETRRYPQLAEINLPRVTEREREESEIFSLPSSRVSAARMPSRYQSMATTFHAAHPS